MSFYTMAAVAIVALCALCIAVVFALPRDEQHFYPCLFLQKSVVSGPNVKTPAATPLYWCPTDS